MWCGGPSRREAELEVSRDRVREHARLRVLWWALRPGRREAAPLGDLRQGRGGVVGWSGLGAHVPPGWGKVS